MALITITMLMSSLRHEHAIQSKDSDVLQRAHAFTCSSLANSKMNQSKTKAGFVKGLAEVQEAQMNHGYVYHSFLACLTCV